MALVINGVTYIADDVKTTDDVVVGDDLSVGDDATVTGTLTVTEKAIIGDAGSTSHSLSDDSMFVSGKFEVDSTAYFDGAAQFYGAMASVATNGSTLGLRNNDETVTIAVGQGAGGVASTGDLCEANSLILGCVARVTNAPGGGATTIDIGITGSGNADELIDGMSTALNTTATSPANNDGTQLPLLNASDTTLTLTTDANVTGDDMQVRVVVYSLRLGPYTS